MNAYYLIEEEYIGPNKKDSTGAWIGDTWHWMSIFTEPGKTNMSREPREDGWLGTTNDWCRTAHGEYETLDEARAEANRRGFTEEYKDEDSAMDNTYVESWVTEIANKEQWDAGDWLDGCTYCAKDNSNVTIDKLVITANTTDEELSEMADEIYKLAEAEGNIELHGLEKCLESWRDWCEKEESDDEEDQ